jgi:hypothetical protein
MIDDYMTYDSDFRWLICQRLLLDKFGALFYVVINVKCQQEPNKKGVTNFRS